jgi:hypothetical protein
MDVGSSDPIGGFGSGKHVAEVDHTIGQCLRAGELQNAGRLFRVVKPGAVAAQDKWEDQ